ncbi:YebC/PmpR family DNA-binding transcriptional regulator [Candidatus Campbellbacteria bacterium]|nr:MAG: YebC/PmpR family DNA-binding transcriptional regulator [Candidatus Campbellbacteria bacterium]
MSGHNKWSQIKEKKGATDAKRGKLFTKLVKLIKTEARITKGDLNAPTLKAAIEKARTANMPKDNIDRAIQSAQNTAADEKVVYEAFGPGGCALIIEGLTDSKNRTSQEMKHLLSEHDLALAAPGSASWAFTKTHEGWTPTTTVPLSEEDGAKLSALIEELENNDDVQEVYTNAE